ncbi:hypothetical protein E2562_020278 [Oryza meyeriana var. granulata]|uniref:Uncharacterized protein n=1 Tax=Oryza meyeriana var. granulata TaxID=110450 RepID=A0A6G1DKJ4_9ORYZ|nr:hypothetical protein E2562_020278 [Oryza meyeriana var. granulata]
MVTRPRSSPSFFGGLRARELSGGRLPRASAARLPYLADLSSDPGGRGSGVIAVEHAGDPAIPFAISFCKAEQISHLLAVADEDGYVGLYDTRRRLPSSSSALEKSGTCIQELIACAELIVTGSRDGSFALWDLRCDLKAPNGHREACLIIVKIWDTRNIKLSFSNRSSQAAIQPSEGVKHGISCLSQDSYGAYIAASCMDNRIYLYSVLHMDKGPVKVYTGSKIESFFVKSAISPDGTHILGGSSDGNVYLWQVDQPESGPIILEGHEGEATSVDWCASEIGKIATSSDDSKVLVWNTERRVSPNISSPTVIRKRITAPNTGCRSASHELATTSRDVVPCTSADGESPTDSRSPLQPRVLEFGTPESAKKRAFGLFQEDSLDMRKSPEVQMNSPSSVLSPPPSLKRRTIRDYFASSTS